MVAVIQRIISRSPTSEVETQSGNLESKILKRIPHHPTFSISFYVFFLRSCPLQCAVWFVHWVIISRVNTLMCLCFNVFVLLCVCVRTSSYSYLRVVL